MTSQSGNGENKRQRGSRRNRLLLVAGGVALIAVLVIAVGAGTYSTRFCTTCHVMQPEYKIIQGSAHGKLTCVTCHTNRAGIGFFRLSTGLRGVYQTLTSKYPWPIQPRFKITNDVCLSCHTLSRTVTPSGDLIVPHAQHVEQNKVNCLDCHVGVGHTQVLQEQEYASVAYTLQSSTLEQLGHLPEKEFRPRMATCLNCHNGKKAPYSCEYCHKQIKVPANHQQADWKTAHGQLAMQNINECVYCHALASGKLMPGDSVKKMSLGEAVRFNDFCMNCHQKRPPSHDSQWRITHKQQALQNKQGCLVCHPEKSGDLAAGRNVRACATCHQAEHSANWKEQHRFVVKEKGLIGCFKCHATSHCAQCHTGGTQ